MEADATRWRFTMPGEMIGGERGARSPEGSKEPRRSGAVSEGADMTAMTSIDAAGEKLCAVDEGLRLGRDVY